MLTNSLYLFHWPILILFIYLLFFLFKLKVFSNNQTFQASNHKSIFEVILISSSISLLLYSLFNIFSELIWSTNIKLPITDYTTWIRPWRYNIDGAELFVLYGLTFISVILSFFAVRYYDQIKTKFIKNKITYLSFLALFIFLTFSYLARINFAPPMMFVADSLTSIIFVLSIIAIFIIILLRTKEKLLNWIIPIVLLPIIFVAIQPINEIDYGYIFSPALRLISGFPISEIYFQYDILLSLFAALWMKLHINLNIFQILGQASFYIFILGLFFWSKKFFISKKLSYLLLLALLIDRFYALMHDPINVFQVTPLRLDLWLILLILVYYKGVYHWLVGLTIGLLIIFHENFGLIYFISYLEFVTILFIIDLTKTKLKLQINNIKSLIKEHWQLNWRNLSIIAFFIIITILIFKGSGLTNTSTYANHGLGFMKIGTISFYWYIPVLLSTTTILLFYLKKNITKQYFRTALFVILLAIGNSLYFFGRSHEHNIINIASTLILTIFILFDLLIFRMKKDSIEKPHSLYRIIIYSLPIIFILMSGFYYSGRIIHKTKLQLTNLTNRQFIYDNPTTNPLLYNDFATELQRLTNNSKNIYFALDYDFYLYYYGGYTPVGFQNPYLSWIIKDELINFINNLIINDYYIVIRNNDELLTNINYTNSESIDQLLILSNK